MQRCQCEMLPDDGSWYCETPQIPGVWSNEETREDAQVELREVLQGWLAVGLRLGELIPELDALAGE